MARKSAYDALKLENQLCFPLYAAARKVVSRYTPLLRPLGITYTQYIVFLVLWERDGETVGELCRKLKLDSGTMTPLLKKMEDEGFVTRERGGEDERVVTVRLTQKGLGLREAARDIPARMGECLSLSGAEAKTLYALLYRVIGDME
jgi:DNA-binding MarR family transcriptional regulator